ncbi:MAG: hypothetical protein ACXW3E_13165 [Thermoanaerobaculia bacterium]
MKNDRKALRIAAIAFLFSGAALVAHILAGISLRLSLAFTAAVLIASLAIVWRRSDDARRERLRALVTTGLLAGIFATAVYDGSKFVLSRGTRSAYNPFEAIRAFGRLLAGPSAGDAAILASGTAFHVLNGTCFGIAYCLLFRRRNVLTGIAWGLFLELFQLTLFPGWLDIRAYREFVQISVLSHIIYGCVLAYASNWIFRKLGHSDIE